VVGAEDGGSNEVARIRWGSSCDYWWVSWRRGQEGEEEDEEEDI